MILHFYSMNVFALWADYRAMHVCTESLGPTDLLHPKSPSGWYPSVTAQDLSEEGEIRGNCHCRRVHKNQRWTFRPLGETVFCSWLPHALDLCLCNYATLNHNFSAITCSHELGETVLLLAHALLGCGRGQSLSWRSIPLIILLFKTDIYNSKSCWTQNCGWSK